MGFFISCMSFYPFEHRHTVIIVVLISFTSKIKISVRLRSISIGFSLIMDPIDLILFMPVTFYCISNIVTFTYWILDIIVFLYIFLTFSLEYSLVIWKLQFNFLNLLGSTTIIFSSWVIFPHNWGKNFLSILSNASAFW